MFINNKYSEWYYSIIDRAKSRELDGYKERHHIIPKSWGGSNNADNLVDLTAREHYICHLLLIRMTEGELKAKMYLAIRRFNKVLFRRNSKFYEQVRIKANEAFRGYKHTPEAIDKIKQAALKKRKPMSAETRAKISAVNKGRVRSDEFKENLRTIYAGRTRDENKKWV